MGAGAGAALASVLSLESAASFGVSGFVLPTGDGGGAVTGVAAAAAGLAGATATGGGGVATCRAADGVADVEAAVGEDTVPANGAAEGAAIAAASALVLLVVAVGA